MALDGTSGDTFVEVLEGRQSAIGFPEDARHWFETYSELIATEEWLLDDSVPEANTLKFRLERLLQMKARQEYWRAKCPELDQALLGESPA